MRMNRKCFVVLVLLFASLFCDAQITAGKIVYERKTNLYKKFKDDNVKDWIKEIDKIKIKIDSVELIFKGI